MSHHTEFGRERGVGRLIPRLIVIGAVLAFAIGTAWELLEQRHVIAMSTDKANVSAVAGAPCPAVSAAAFASALRAQQLTLKYVFDFNGVTFGRAIGDADCDAAKAKGAAGLGAYAVCEFTGPAVLSVKTSRGEFFFLPGVGHKATVMTPGEIPGCVMAAPKLDY